MSGGGEWREKVEGMVEEVVEVEDVEEVHAHAIARSITRRPRRGVAGCQLVCERILLR